MAVTIEIGKRRLGVQFAVRLNVRYGSQADMPMAGGHVRSWVRSGHDLANNGHRILNVRSCGRRWVMTWQGAGA